MTDIEKRTLRAMNLQLFAEDLGDPEDEDFIDGEEEPEDYGDLEVYDEEPEDSDSTEDEGHDEGSDEDTEAEGSPRAPGVDEEDDEDEAEDSSERRLTQEEVNRLVEERLARDRRQREREFRNAAGYRISNEDVREAVRLWGFLYHNPQLSQEVQRMIDQAVSSGKARTLGPSTDDLYDEMQKELDLREARLELRMSDKVFRKNEQAILEWAGKNGFPVDDARTLKLAYLAWRGENSRKLEADAELRGQRKARTRAKMAKKANLQGANSRRRKPVDYSKMSDEEILASEGLSLFTDD